MHWSQGRTYECNGEVCGTGNERRPCKVFVVVELESIDICASGGIAPRGTERRAGDSHHSQDGLVYLNQKELVAFVTFVSIETK